ncbi:DUF6297 family protein [Mumia sp. ZJ430]|uniref:DUF6297 family protein n=1 Tax=Mumia sp. ZJ430 TaxID=2708083 RepID=UPI001423309A|nr:DUF6297 family protein [Mumia sp. ZJ430]
MFATIMLGGMFVNAVVQVGGVTDQLCASAACRDARSLVPWLVAGGCLVTILVVARLFGPVYVTPADGSWLLSSPLDRASLLRPRLTQILLAATVVTLATVGVGVVLAGTALTSAVAFAAATSLLATATAAAAAYAQEQDRRALATASQWVLVVVLWCAVLSIAVGEAPRMPLPAADHPASAVAVVVVAAAAVLAGTAAWRRLGRLRHRDVVTGGELTPGLSGALATLDLALAYDVVLSHRWKGRGSVRARRGGPGGALALVGSDVLRLRRSPQRLVVLAATAAVPYAATAAGAGRFVVLVAATAGFVACLPLLSGLRVMARGPSLARAMPFSSAVAQAATAAVPTVAALAYGMATAAAMRQDVAADREAALLCGLAVGVAVAASGVRWVTRRPPDYSKPLIATPAGAIPTNLYGSVIAGFDVLLLTTTPMLLAPDLHGASVSLALGAGVWAFLVSRSPAR